MSDINDSMAFQSGIRNPIILFSMPFYEELVNGEGKKMKIFTICIVSYVLNINATGDVLLEASTDCNSIVMSVPEKTRRHTAPHDIGNV